MVLVTNTYGNWTTYEGTVAEVGLALAEHNANSERVHVVHTGAAVVAFVFGK